MTRIQNELRNAANARTASLKSQGCATRPFARSTSLPSPDGTTISLCTWIAHTPTQQFLSSGLACSGLSVRVLGADIWAYLFLEKRAWGFVGSGQSRVVVIFPPVPLVGY